MFRVTVMFANKNPDTIWNRLAAKLGREPTNAEAKAEVLRILDECMVDRAGRGQLWFQKGRAA